MRLIAPSASISSEPCESQRQLVLRNLVALRQVRIKIILAREDGALLNLAFQRQRRANGQFARARGSAPATPPANPDRLGKYWNSARRQSAWNSRRTLSCASSAARALRARSRPRSAPAHPRPRVVCFQSLNPWGPVIISSGPAPRSPSRRAASTAFPPIRIGSPRGNFAPAPDIPPHPDTAGQTNSARWP